MGLDGMKESKALASDMMKLTFGEAGAVVLSLIVIAAALSTLNATVFTGARTNYAVGPGLRDFLGARDAGKRARTRRSTRCCCRA